MADVFAGSEVVEICVEIERNGYTFYESVAAKLSDPAVVKLARWLGEQEREHERIFVAMLEGLRKADTWDSYEGEYALYMKALSQSHVFTGTGAATTLVEKITSDADMLDAAAWFEKDTILFLHEMKPAVPAAEQPVIERLINEERGHLRKINELRERLV